ncbi:MAG: 16S rRNA (guanine(966)-N(2))-methyltransferase RsmD [Candidatus Dormibacteraeota bacterium]|uniref:16S rRNA (Guanine(966)-N(2))-methyltransferase RsmD n=1 Tax=Candidatus Aeolococcus gillhamiae TaxID=3127015 RepID=A0A2W5ZBK7_9BACT|nr:16S rRNA (guanine(966)-N(2))-methyltransferase RsmD [Candidatus Dormibacteraeota bacterium]PZR82790.1 MAG: 16S rRNA (guanine(966)-N(2))-methyltransferase RsmD [Candidatus Dormibacter sp. RRmetagenome_bin12]
MPTTAQTRITGGEWRGRRLSTPREQILRPTRAMVREAIFNILGDEVVGATVVDIFAGAGTVGFEALSRGAAQAVFVDRDERALAHVRATAQALGCAERCQVIRADALGWVRSRPAELRAGDVVFLDAPYRDDTGNAVLDALGEAPPRVVVCEHHRARSLPDRIGGLAVVRHRRYGITDLSVLRPAVTEVGIGE